jgi:hypothetical protein
LQQSDIETLLAAFTPFGFVLQTAYLLPPDFVVIILVYPSDTERIRVTLTFILANLVLFTRINVGIKIIDHRLYPMGQ